MGAPSMSEHRKEDTWRDTLAAALPLAGRLLGKLLLVVLLAALAVSDVVAPLAPEVLAGVCSSWSLRQGPLPP